MARSINMLLGRVSQIHQSPFDPERFIACAAEELEAARPSLADLHGFVEEGWDVGSTVPYWIDTDSPPFLVDLYTHADWCLRATVWEVAQQEPWKDTPHNHFGYIATTALSEVAYQDRVYKSFRERDIASGGELRTLSRAHVHIIRPSTIHEVVVMDAPCCISLSVRTRAIEDITYEYNRTLGKLVRRTKSAKDRKDAVLGCIAKGISR